jgi:hypothetical protein
VQHLLIEIHVLAWDMYKIVVGISTFLLNCYHRIVAFIANNVTILITVANLNKLIQNKLYERLKNKDKRERANIL